jgi:nucleoid-associated protein YgaU
MATSYTRRSITSRHPRTSWVLGLLVLLLAAPAYSQSLGDIARQERERKANQPNHATHVYTNDDLARPQILVPEDQARIEPKEKEEASPTASESPAQAAPGQPQAEGLPLGDIARRYRALNEARQKNETTATPRQAAQSRPSPPVVSQPVANIARQPQPARQIAKVNSEPAGKTVHGEEITGSTPIRFQAGDTLWRLARKYLGRGEDWTLLARVNPQVGDPTRIRVGTLVRLPDRPLAALHPPASVRVERGDTLWRLTRAYFGNGEAWQCLAQVNPQIKNTNLIFAGQTLRIPEDCAANPVPRVPDLSVSSNSLPSPTAATP